MRTHGTQMRAPHLALSSCSTEFLFICALPFGCSRQQNRINDCAAHGVTVRCFLWYSRSPPISVGWGGIAASVFSVILITQTGIESINTFSAEKGQRRSLLSLLLTCAVAASLFIGMANETQWFIRENHTFVIENYFRGNVNGQQLDAKLASGPLKGIYTDKQVATVYDAIIHDLDTIRENTDSSDNVLVSSLAPFLYLYLDRNYADFTEYNRRDEQHKIEAYWQEHPEKKPDYIYCPYFDLFTYTATEMYAIEGWKDTWARYFDFEVTQGEAGEILRVIRQKPTP